MTTPTACGHVFWITGYSGAGKTTIAHALQRQMPPGVLLLDGDVLRSIFGARHGYGREDRLQLALSYAHLCREVSSQGIDVICATISMFHEVRGWNRASMPRYHEIYVRVPLEERARRDPKGLYARAANGDNHDMGGLDLGLEEPESPDLTIDNHGMMLPEMAAATIRQRFTN